MSCLVTVFVAIQLYRVGSPRQVVFTFVNVAHIALPHKIGWFWTQKVTRAGLEPATFSALEAGSSVRLARYQLRHRAKHMLLLPVCLHKYLFLKPCCTHHQENCALFC
jgi:hypothetical protein